MIEMLVAAFILAVGTLGLAMLQTMALRSNAGTGSRNSAVLVASRVLDQAEAVGRNSVLCARSGNTPPTLSPTYFGAAFTQYYQFDGTYTATSGYYTVTVTPTDVVTPVAGVGGIKLLTVLVSWTEALDKSGTAIPRTMTLSRRISYATS
jgi:Tfp pilus assembly protein PilV